MRFFIFFLFAIALTACTTKQPLTRTEALSTSCKTYKGVDKEQILNAAQKIFLLSDGNDFTFSHSKNGMIASRFYNIYMVLGVVQGNYVWDIDVEDSGSGTVVNLSVEDRSGGFLAPTISSQCGTPAVNKLFFSRLDYMLGLSDEWLTCKDAKKIFSGNLEPWCLVTADKKPTQARKQLN